MSNGIGKPVLLAFMLLCCFHQAQATDLACGTYQDRESTDNQLVVDSPLHAHELSASIAPRRYEYRRSGDVLQMADLDAGYVARYKVAGKDRIIDESGFHDYVLAEPATCKAVAAPAAAGTCRADLPACLENAYDADEATLRKWCEVESVPFACDKLIDLYKTQAKGIPEAAPGPEIEKPAACEEGMPDYSDEKCLTAVKQLVGKQLTTGLAEAFGSMYADAKPLPATRLDHALAMCSDSKSTKVCDNAAGVLWEAGRYLQAREALEIACMQGDPEACNKAEPLLGLGAKDERLVPASALPCGDYLAATGLISELKFGDRGMVEGGFGRRMRARLEGGQVRVRHDKGGDFVFRVLDAQRLLGIDSWNQYAFYERQGGQEQCAAPVPYVEKSLQADCPAILQDGGAKACCDAGKLQGCNALGHQHALQGDWQSATPYYLQICAAGVRAGCENLLQSYANGGGDSVIEALGEICLDAPGHVACDVQETTNWEALGLANALQKMGDALEAESTERATGTSNDKDNDGDR